MVQQHCISSSFSQGSTTLSGATVVVCVCQAMFNVRSYHWPFLTFANSWEELLIMSPFFMKAGRSSLDPLPMPKLSSCDRASFALLGRPSREFLTSFANPEKHLLQERMGGSCSPVHSGLCQILGRKQRAQRSLTGDCTSGSELPSNMMVLGLSTLLNKNGR